MRLLRCHFASGSVLCLTSSPQQVHISAKQHLPESQCLTPFTLYLYKSQAAAPPLQPWRCCCTALAAAASGCSPPCSSCQTAQCMSLPLLQDLVSHPITLDDEASEAGSDAGADDPVLFTQQPAAHTRPQERQPVPTSAPAADDTAAEQVKQPHLGWRPQHASQPTSALMLGVTVSHARA